MHINFSVSFVFFPEIFQQKSSIQFIFINVPNQQSDGQLQRQNNKETQITNDNQQDTYETNKINNRIFKPFITHDSNDNTKSDSVR